MKRKKVDKMQLTLSQNSNKEQQVSLIFVNASSSEDNQNQVVFNFKEEQSAVITLSLLRKEVQANSQKILTLTNQIDKIDVDIKQKLMSSDTLDVVQKVGDFLYLKAKETN